MKKKKEKKKKEKELLILSQTAFSQPIKKKAPLLTLRDKTNVLLKESNFKTGAQTLTITFDGYMSTQTYNELIDFMDPLRNKYKINVELKNMTVIGKLI